MAIYVAPRSVKAGPIGSGAGVLLTEYPLFSFLKQDQHEKMRTAYRVGMNTPWIRRAEMLIGSKVATVDFDLDDGDPVAKAEPVADPHHLNRAAIKTHLGLGLVFNPFVGSFAQHYTELSSTQMFEGVADLALLDVPL